MAQNRFTAVGRVPASRAQIFSNSGANSLRSQPSAQCTKRNAVSGGNANRRRAAHNHGDNDIGHLFVIGGQHIALLERKLRLIDKSDAFRGPGKGRNHALPV